MSDIVARLPGVSTPVFAPWFVLRTSCRAWLRFLPADNESSHATFAEIHWIIAQPTLLHADNNACITTRSLLV